MPRVLARLVAKAPRIQRNLEARGVEVCAPKAANDAHGDCAHEIGHAIEANALAPALRERIVVLYETSMDMGRWKDALASTSHSELFAEATRLWLSDPQRLQDEDPDAYAFVRALYEDELDPGEPPRELAIQPSPASEEADAKSEESRVPVRVRIANRTPDRVRIRWLDFDGNRDQTVELSSVPSAIPGETIAIATFANHWFVVTDLDGRALATFEAPATDALLTLR